MGTIFHFYFVSGIFLLRRFNQINFNLLTYKETIILNSPCSTFSSRRSFGSWSRLESSNYSKTRPGHAHYLLQVQTFHSSTKSEFFVGMICSNMLRFFWCGAQQKILQHNSSFNLHSLILS